VRACLLLANAVWIEPAINSDRPSHQTMNRQHPVASKNCRRYQLRKIIIDEGGRRRSSPKCFLWRQVHDKRGLAHTLPAEVQKYFRLSVRSRWRCLREGGQQRNLFSRLRRQASNRPQTLSGRATHSIWTFAKNHPRGYVGEFTCSLFINGRVVL